MPVSTLEKMVQNQIESRGITDQRILQAFKDVDRKLFVPKGLEDQAYEDGPLPIGHGQTISQPFIVAFMLDAAMLNPSSKVLEIGTGSVYQTALLSKLCKKVYSIEIVETLAKLAISKTKALKLQNVHIRVGDGHLGWPEAAPFDAIIVTAAPGVIPQALISQLKMGGKLIIPVGTHAQKLLRITRTSSGIEQEELLAVRFVPMVQDRN